MKGGIKNSGFLQMVFSVLAIVLVASMFSTIMTSLKTLMETAGVSSFIAFTTIVGITPTLLLLGLTVGSGITFLKGQKLAGASDPGGMIRVVFGILMLILFITLFTTIATSFATLNTSYGSNSTWVAFGTVITIVPTILFLGGIVGAISTSVQGYKAHKSRRALA
jgi:hypothetical protein